VEAPGLELADQVPDVGDGMLEAGGAGAHLSCVVGVATGHAGQPQASAELPGEEVLVL
jgi:hypothetical protein